MKVIYLDIDNLPLTVPRLIRPNPEIGLQPFHIQQARKLFA